MSRSQLENARSVPLPTREDMLRRDPSVQQFWITNRDLFAEAWTEWEQELDLPVALDESLLDVRLRTAVSEAWEDPTTESAVQDLWHEVAPDVYQAQFFDPERIAELRRYLDATADADIPLRPPYGIVLNRRGAMLDRRSEGYLAAPGFQTLYQTIMDRYMRPISRLLFPEVMGYDSQTFGFSIHYQPNTDTSIQPHTDASSVTLNINLNLPGEEFSGSGVDFFDQATHQQTRLVFEPGTALIHRGRVAHAAQPITSGERSNVVLWLYGNHGRTPPMAHLDQARSAEHRWTLPTEPADGFAPF